MGRRFPLIGLLTLALSGLSATAYSQNAELRAAFEKGENLRTQGKAAEAVPHLETANRLAPSVFGADGADTATIHLSLANAYRDLGKYAQAEPLYQRSLQIREAKFGANDVKVAEVLNSQANVYLMQAKYAQAVPIYERSLKIKEQKLGANHFDVAITVSNIAIAYEKLGKYNEAEKNYARALKVKEAQPQRNEISIANTQYSLATLYNSMSRTKEAEDYFKRSLKTREAKLGADHVDVALNLNELGNLYQGQGRYLEAETMLERSLKIREAQLGPNHPAVGLSLFGLGLVKQRLGQVDRAEAHLTRALKINEATFGPNHRFVADVSGSLANLYRMMGQPEKAEPLMQRSLTIIEAHVGPDHPSVATELGNLGLLYIQLNRQADAEPYIQRGLKIYEAKFGPDHPSTAMLLHYLGLSAWGQGRNPEALGYFQRSLTIREAQFGAVHPDVARSLQLMAQTAAAGDNLTDAAKFTDRGRRVARQHIAQVLPALSEADQLAFLKQLDHNHFHEALSIGLLRKDDPAAVTQSAAWVLNGKAMTQQALVERLFPTRDLKDPAAGKISEQLAAIRKQLASSIADAEPAAPSADRKRRLDQLRQQETSLSKQLAQAAGRPAGDTPWIETAALRKAIPDDAVFLDFVRVEFRAFRGGETDPGPHYAVWLIPPAGQGEPELFNLGPAGPIEDAVQKVRRELATAGEVIRKEGEAAAEKQLRPPIEALSQLVLQPMTERLTAKDRWILSPDAALWLLPWEALAWDEGYVTEKHQISYVVSGRDLVLPAPTHAKMNPPMIMADPDFDLNAAQTQAETKRVLTEAQLRSLTRTPTRSLQLGAVQRLPGTAKEAEAVRPNLEKYANAKPLVYTGKNALEGVFKVFARPQAAVLSTHGFFQDDQAVSPAANPVAANESRPPRDAQGQTLENPLLRCGLLLAGVNQRGQGRAPDQDDGILTGLEIVSADLRGTKLVVLSACETGLGEVRNGEGVAGLRQAFHLAGAQSVAATMWQIPDVESARLVSDFFENLAAQQSPGDALRNSQLKQIESRRGRFGAAHPFFWAAYTITGRSGT